MGFILDKMFELEQGSQDPCSNSNSTIWQKTAGQGRAGGGGSKSFAVELFRDGFEFPYAILQDGYR